MFACSCFPSYREQGFAEAATYCEGEMKEMPPSSRGIHEVWGHEFFW